MARLQVVPLPGGRYGVVIDELEADERLSCGVGTLVSVPSDPVKHADLSGLRDSAEFVVLTEGTLDAVVP